MHAGWICWITCNWINQLSLLFQTHKIPNYSTIPFQHMHNGMSCRICNFTKPFYQFFETRNIETQGDKNIFQYKLNNEWMNERMRVYHYNSISLFKLRLFWILLIPPVNSNRRNIEFLYIVLHAVFNRKKSKNLFSIVWDTRRRGKGFKKGKKLRYL